MLKALLRKQFLEIRNAYLTGKNHKTGKKGAKPKNPKGMMVLFAVIYVVIMISMFFMSLGIGSSLIPAGLDWLYFTVINVIAFILGVFGSVLSTAQAIFRSKDNEFLLAMPIPASRIVFVRMISVFAMGFLYEAVVMVPGIVYYFIAGQPSVLAVIFCILSLFIMAFLVTAFSCAAGWLVAYISTKLKNQKVILAFLLMILICVVYYFQFNASRMINHIIQNASQIAESIRGWGFVLYAPGLGMTGHLEGFLTFLAITGILFVIAYVAVTKSFSRIALFKTQEKHTEFQRDAIRTTNVPTALLRREFKRFFSSIPYMFNAGIGCLILLVLAGVVFWKLQDIRMMITRIGSDMAVIDRIVPVMLACAVCILASFCEISASSISMEAKYLWIYQTMPVDPYAIFRGKIHLHAIMTGIPALLLVLALGIAVQTSIPAFICMVVFVAMFVYLTASLGLLLDLRKPKLSWTNENQAIKTNLNVLVIMLLGLVVPIAFGALYLALVPFLGPEMYLVILIAISAALTLLVHRWLAGKGRAIFRYL